MHAKTLRAAAVLMALPAFAQSPAPQRTILENRVTQGKAKDSNLQPAGAPERTIDSLLNSTEDLNSIRDAYLRRLGGDGCRPDVAIRVAELRARLDDNDLHRGRPQNTAAAIQQTNAELTDSLLILASGWYQPRAENTASRANPERDRAQLLDFVLSAKDSVPAASPGAAAAQSKAELERLLATCRGVAH
jgi:hypothetical protein